MSSFDNKYSELYHYGVRGMKWGYRRFQNKDGSLTAEGYIHYGYKGPRNNKREGLRDWSNAYTGYDEIKKSFKKTNLLATDSQMKSQHTKNCKVLDVLDKMQSGKSLTEAEKKILGKPSDSPYSNERVEEIKTIFDSHATEEEKRIVNNENDIADLEWATTIKREHYSRLYDKFNSEKTRDELNDMAVTYNTMEGYFNNCPFNTVATELKARGIQATAGCAVNADSGEGGLYDPEIKKIFNYTDVSFVTKKHGNERKPFIGVDPDNKDVIRLGCENMYAYDCLANNKKIKKRMEAFCKNTGVPNARFAFVCRGHICNAFTDEKGELFVKDGQVGTVQPCVEYMNTWLLGATLLRTDNRQLNVAQLKKTLEPKRGDYNNVIFLGGK